MQGTAEEKEREKIRSQIIALKLLLSRGTLTQTEAFSPTPCMGHAGVHPGTF